MRLQAALLPDGKRLHLQHGPIDLIIGADGDRAAAFAAAEGRFATILEELVTELPLLRAEMDKHSPCPVESVAKRMDRAMRPFCGGSFVTRMAAVAGSVADEVLEAMQNGAELRRAYVNNGGDIALHLTPGTRFTLAMAGHDGRDLGRIEIRASDPVRGIATSGRHGRSLSLGIADSVTVLAGSAAEADAAATLIVNAVDLPDHPAVTRRPACHIVDDSDLGDRPAVTHCDTLDDRHVDLALSKGLARAQEFLDRRLIFGAALFLQSDCRATQTRNFSIIQRIKAHA